MSFSPRFSLGKIHIKGRVSQMFKNFRTRDQIASIGNPIVFDVRFKMDNPTYGLKAYEEKHYKGSVYLDLTHDLSAIIKEHGGRHPLPMKKDLQETLRKAGLNNHQPVLIYDDGDNVAAGRLWWLLKYYGVDEVYVLLGGFSQFKEEDLTSDLEGCIPGDINLLERDNMVVDHEIIRNLSKSMDYSNVQLVDSRDEQRYLGIIEPIDKKKGHIPGASNIPYKVHFTENGDLKSKEILARNFKNLNTEKETIFYCGSGVTACSNIMVYDELGLSSKLYPGSFSDYISYDDNQVVVK